MSELAKNAIDMQKVMAKTGAAPDIDGSLRKIGAKVPSLKALEVKKGQMIKLHPELKSLEREITSIADFSGMPRAKTGGLGISKVLDAVTSSKTKSSSSVVDALKNIREASEVKIKKISKPAKAVVVVSAPMVDSTEDTTEINQLM